MAYRPGGPKEAPSIKYLKARGLLPKPPRKLPADANHVYFIKAVTIGCIKIGKADCVRTRFRTLRTNSPDTLLLLGVVSAHNGSALERALHDRFASHRLHGEWFKPAPEILAYIAEHASSALPMKDWRETRPGAKKRKGSRAGPGHNSQAPPAGT